MRHFFLFACLVLFFFSCKENDDNKKDDKGSQNVDLVKLENDWMTAMMKKDSSALNKFVAPQFTLSGAKDLDRPEVSRATWINNTLQNLNIDSVRFLTTKVNMIDNIGIVRASFFWKGRFGKDEAFTDSTHFIDTWMKTSSGWQVVSRVIAE